LETTATKIFYSRNRLHTKTCIFSIEICSEIEKIMSYLGGITGAEDFGNVNWFKYLQNFEASVNEFLCFFQFL